MTLFLVSSYNYTHSPYSKSPQLYFLHINDIFPNIYGFNISSISYIYYGQQRKLFNNESFVEITMGCLFLLQSILLGIFSVILGSHSTEILDRHGSDRIKQTFSDFSAVSTSSPSNNQYTPPVFE